MAIVGILLFGLALIFCAADRRRRNGIKEDLEDSLKAVTVPCLGVSAAVGQFVLGFWFVIALNLDPNGPANLQRVAQPYLIPGGNINTLQIPIVLGTLITLYGAFAAFRRSLKP